MSKKPQRVSGKRPDDLSDFPLDELIEIYKAVVPELKRRGKDPLAAPITKAYNQGALDQVKQDEQTWEAFRAMMDDLTKAENEVIYATMNFDIWLLAGTGESMIRAAVEYGQALRESFMRLCKKAEQHHQDMSELFGKRIQQVGERLDILTSAFDDEGMLIEEKHRALVDIALAQGDKYRSEIYEASLRDVVRVQALGAERATQDMLEKKRQDSIRKSLPDEKQLIELAVAELRSVRPKRPKKSLEELRTFYVDFYEGRVPPEKQAVYDKLVKVTDRTLRNWRETYGDI